MRQDAAELGKTCRQVAECPACQRTENEVVGDAASPFEELVAGISYYHPPYSIRHCRNCSLYYKSHTISLDQLDAYYRGLDCTSFEVDDNFPTDRLLHQFLAGLPAGCKILDFGCSTGRILKELTTKHACYGVEPNAMAAASATQRGFAIIPPTLLDSGAQQDFDLVLLTDVYEHLVHPLELVNLLFKSLKPGGCLAIVTGNADAIALRERLAEFWYFRIMGHFLMMGKEHAHWLASRLGARIKELHACSHYVSSVKTRFIQRVQSFAYVQFKSSPTGIMSALLRATPMVNRAQGWNNAPAVSFGPDHFVLILEKP